MVKEYVKQVFKNIITWVIMLFVIFAVAMFLGWFEVASYFLAAVLSICLAYGIVVMIYAFIINPINNYCKTGRFTIRKGFRRKWFTFPLCLPRLKNLKKPFVKYIQFTESCFIDNVPQINKLYGFTDSIFSTVHSNSFRFGWQTNKDHINIFAYYYINGQRDERFICEIPKAMINEDIYFEMKPTGISIDFIVKFSESTFTQSVLFPKAVLSPTKKKYGWECGLYFGGKKKAPQNITFFIS